MLRSLALVGALALACLSSDARATVTIGDDPGGVLGDFIGKYEALARTGQRVEIAGRCMSACTLILGIVPRDRICVRQNATMEFHSAAYRPGGDYAEGGTELMRRFYAKDVRRILARHGWDARSPHPALIPISGKELRSIVRPCNR